MLRYLVFAMLLAAAFAAKSYEGYKVFRITPQNERQLNTVTILQKTLKNYVDFWKPPRQVGRPVDIMVRPEYQPLVLSLLDGKDLSVETTVENLQADIDSERDGGSITDTLDYEDYNTLETINGWMTTFASDNPSLVTVVTVGSSFEGRDIMAIKIGASGFNKDAVWYEGGIHAREWISPATLIYMAKLLVDGYGSDADVTSILNELDVYILPVYNVDGYEYTWTGDRMWRKTRSTNPGSTCKGADPNRNWDFAWGDESNLKCSDLYQGPNANSEIEVESVTIYISSLGNKVKAFIDFHAYGLMWMTPWGYTYSYPSDFADQDGLTTQAVNALTAVYGTTYATGSIANTIYTASGSSADWAYGYAGIKYSFAVELRGNSFSIHKLNIEPSGIETFEALKVISLAVIS